MVNQPVLSTGDRLSSSEQWTGLVTLAKRGHGIEHSNLCSNMSLFCSCAGFVNLLFFKKVRAKTGWLCYRIETNHNLL